MLRAAPRSSNRSGAMVPRPLQELQELEELSAELGKLLLSERAAALLRQSLELQARGDSGLLAAQAGATRMDTELRAAEESVARDLVAREAAVQRRRQQLWELREELRREREALGSIRDCNGYPLGSLHWGLWGLGSPLLGVIWFGPHPIGSYGPPPPLSSLHCRTALHRELEELQARKQELKEDEEKAEEGLISLQYLLHLYQKLSRISWDSEAKPWHVKGIHFGPPIAQPVDIDSRNHSHCFISDYLWSLIPHEW
ncbi:kinetochore protein Spc24 [Guaruba guarouba]